MVPLTRYYASFKRDISYKKRVPWFEHVPSRCYSDKMSTSIVEYVGQFLTGPSRHGTVTKSANEC